MTPAPRPIQVFIVDDSSSIRARLAEMLAGEPALVVVGEAATAREAVIAILRLRPDAVLLDLNLQGNTGLDVMRGVLPSEPGIAFVVLTNHSEPQYRRACSLAGARHFLDKTTEFQRVPAILAALAVPAP